MYPWIALTDTLDDVALVRHAGGWRWQDDAGNWRSPKMQKAAAVAWAKARRWELYISE